MRLSQLITASLAGVTLALGTPGACTVASEETRTCEQWLSELAPEQQDYALNVCDADTDTLDPLTDEQITKVEFRERQDALAESSAELFSEESDDTEPGMRPCEDWLDEFGEDDTAICWQAELWPDTPLSEAEFLVFYETYARDRVCAEVLIQDGTYDTREERECDETYLNGPTLAELRGE